MARERIGHARAEQHLRSVHCQLAEARIDLAIEPLVRHPHRAVAVRFGEPCAFNQLRDGRVTEQQQLKGHERLWRSTLTSSGLIRSGTVQPARSYSAMHVSANAFQRSAWPEACAPSSAKRRISSWLPE